MAGGIFINVLPRMELAALAAAVTQMKGIFSKAGAEMQASMDAQAAAAVRSADVIARAETAATDARIRSSKAVGDLQVADARREELRASGAEATSSRMIRAEVAYQDAVARSEALSVRSQRAQEALATKQAANADVMAASAVGTTGVMNKAFSTLGIASTAAFVGIGVESGKMAGQYEKSLTQMQAMTGETSDQVKILHDGLLQMSGTLGTSLDQLTQAATIAAKSGIKDAGDQLKYVAAAAQLARIEGAPLENTMKGLTTTMQDFSFSAGQTADVASMIRTAVGNSKVPIDEFTGSLHNLEPVFKSLVNGDAAKSVPMFSQMAGMLAQMTQNGTGADQATENLRNTVIHLINPIQSQRTMVEQLGGSFAQLSKDVSDPSKGPIGVMTELNDLITKNMTPDMQAHITEVYHAVDAGNVLKDMYDKLTPAQQQMADAVENGSAKMADVRKAEKENVDGSGSMLAQWDAQRKTVEGFNPLLKKYGDQVISLQQAWKGVTGTDQGFLVASQQFGSKEATAALNKSVSDIANSHSDAKGQVEGFSDITGTYQFKLDAAKNSLHALTVELGEAFLPALKTVADGLKETFQWLSRHEEIAKDVVYGIGLIGAAWVTTKVAMAIGTVVQAVTTGFGLIRDAGVAAYDMITTRAGASAEKIIAADELVKTNALATNDAIGAERVAAAETGAAGVATASTEEVAAEARVTTAAGEADSALATGGTGAGVSAAARGAGGAGAAGAARFALPVLGAPFVIQQYADSTQSGQNVNKFFDNAQHGGSNNLNDLLDGHAKGGIVGFNSGGVLPGYSTTDNMLGMVGGKPIGLAGGEGIIKAQMIAMLGPEFVHKLNSGDILGAILSLVSGGRGFSGGGITPGGNGNTGPDVLAAEMLAGTPYSQGARNDCSGMVGQVINAATGGGGGLPTTQNMGEWLQARGFVQGIGGLGSISVGWYNHGSGTNDGHAAMTLSDGENAESGGSHGNFLIGSGAAGASSSEFDHHMYLPSIYGEGEGSGGSGSSGSGSSGSSGGGSGSGSGSSNPFGGGGGTGASGFWGKLAQYLTTFLAELAFGNPLGKEIASQKNGSTSGQSGVLTPEQIASMSPADRKAMLAQDAAGRSQSSYQTNLNKYGPDDPRTIKSLTSYNDLLLRQADASDKASDSADSLNAKLKQQTDHLAELTGSGKAKQSTIESAQNSIKKTQDQIADLTSSASDLNSKANTNPALNNPADLSDMAGRSGGLSGPGGRGLKLDFTPSSGDTTGGPVQPAPTITRNDIDQLHDAVKIDRGGIPRSAFDALKDAAPTFGAGSLGGGAGAQAARRGAGQFATVSPLTPGQAGLGYLSGALATGQPTPGSAPLAGVPGVGTTGRVPLGPGASLYGPGLNTPQIPGSPSPGGIGQAAGGGLAPPPGGGSTGPQVPGRAGPTTPPLPGGGGPMTAPAPRPQSSQVNSRQPGQDQNLGSGFGVGGGIIGAAEAAGTMGMGGAGGAAAGAAAAGGGGGGGGGGGISALANRAIGYLGQMAGIGVEGLFETWGLNDSAIGDPTKSLFGKVALGIAGGHPSPTTPPAGQTAPPLTPDSEKGKGKDPNQQPAPMINIENQHINNGGDNGAVNRDMNRVLMQNGVR